MTLDLGLHSSAQMLYEKSCGCCNKTNSCNIAITTKGLLSSQLLLSWISSTWALRMPFYLIPFHSQFTRLAPSYCSELLYPFNSTPQCCYVNMTALGMYFCHRIWMYERDVYLIWALSLKWWSWLILSRAAHLIRLWQFRQTMKHDHFPSPIVPFTLLNQRCRPPCNTRLFETFWFTYCMFLVLYRRIVCCLTLLNLLQTARLVYQMRPDWPIPA